MASFFLRRVMWMHGLHPHGVTGRYAVPMAGLAPLLRLFRCGVLAVACLLAIAVSPPPVVRAGQAAVAMEQPGAGEGAPVWPSGVRFPDIALGIPSPDTGWSGGPDVAMPAPVAGPAGSAGPAGAADPEGLPAHLSDLRGQVFIVNMYSWFCAPCQEEAPALRALHARISTASHGELVGRVRLVGIATGDDWNLVQAFRQRHGLAFPLFADPELAVHGQLGGLPVPYTWVLRREADGFRVLFTHAGALSGTPAEFLDRVLAAAGPLH